MLDEFIRRSYGFLRFPTDSVGLLIGMAEQSPQTSITRMTAPLWRSRAMIAIAGLALTGAAAPMGPPLSLAVASVRTRTVRSGALAPTLISVPIRALRRWLRLRLVPPAIRRTPTSRSDTPALPTVGRPRDGPAGLAGTAGVPLVV